MRSLCLFLGIGLAFAAYGVARDSVGLLANGQHYIKGRLLVGIASGAKLPSLGSTAYGGKVTRIVPGIRLVVLTVPTNVSVYSEARRLVGRPEVAYAEPDYVCRGAQIIPNDPYFMKQWGLDRVGAPMAWTLNAGGAGIKVAIVDSGVDFNHPDLGATYAGGYDFQDNDANPMDVDGHGTRVAGAAVGIADNATGIAGMTFSAGYFALRVGTNNVYPVSNIVSGMAWAVSNGAQVINLSLGTYGYSATLEAAVDSAYSAGVVVVCAAGNDATTSPFYPAACARSVAVAATAPTDTLASFSNSGSWVDLSAPGSGIHTTLPGGGFGLVSGTSSSAALVSGACGLLYNRLGLDRSAVKVDQIRSAIAYTGRPVNSQLAGVLLDLHAALLAVGAINPCFYSDFSDSAWSDVDPNDLTFDGNGNYYTTGTINYPSGGTAYFVNKYSPAGALLWSVVDGGQTGMPLKRGYALAHAITQPILYAAIRYKPAGSNTGHCRIIRFDSDTGAIAWEKQVTTTTFDTPYIARLVNNPTGGVVVCFSDEHIAGNSRIIVSSYEGNGSRKWIYTFDDTPQYEYANDVAVDNAGLVYVAGYSRMTSVSVSDTLLFGLNSSGVLLWSRVENLASYQGGGDDDAAEVVTIDNAHGKVAIGGSFRHQSGRTGRYARLYGVGADPNLGDIWTNWDLPVSGSHESGGLAFGPDGGVNTCAIHKIGPNDPLEILSQSLRASDGGVLWSMNYPIDATGYSSVTAAEPRCDPDGNFYASAFVSYTQDYTEAWVLKLDTSGNQRGVGKANGCYATPLFNRLMEVLPGGMIAIAGKKKPTSGDPAAVLVAFALPGGSNTMTGTCSGHVDLDGYVGGGGLSGTLEFREPGATALLATASITLDANGNYTDVVVPRGVYDVAFKPATWLRQVQRDVVVSADPISADFALANGDANMDNAVNLYDLNQVLLDFMLAAGDASEGSDLDRDLLVGLYDLNIILIAFGLTGED